MCRMKGIRIVSCVVLLVGAIGVAAAQSKPNFSGTWIDPEGNAETIVHDEKSIAFNHGSQGGHHEFTYKLDGTESRNVLKVHGTEQIVSIARARWEGPAIVIEESTTYPDGRKSEKRRTLSLNGSGELEQSFAGKSPDGTMIPERKSTWRREGRARSVDNAARSTVQRCPVYSLCEVSS